MRLDFSVKGSDDYFDKVGKVIDWDGIGVGVTTAEADLIDQIISCGVAIFLMREIVGGSGMLCVVQEDLRRGFIDAYEAKYGEYIEYDDIYG